jgi:hypothetical protein
MSRKALEYPKTMREARSLVPTSLIHDWYAHQKVYHQVGVVYYQTSLGPHPARFGMGFASTTSLHFLMLSTSRDHIVLPSLASSLTD